MSDAVGAHVDGPARDAEVPDWPAMLPIAPVTSTAPLAPVGRATVRERLRLTGVAAAQALLGVPALVLFVLTVVSIPLTLALVGYVVALAVVPATQGLCAVQRWFAGSLLATRLAAGYAPAPSPLRRPATWLRDPVRWRDVGHLAFAATGGLVMSALPALLLLAPAVHLVFAVLDPGWVWLVLLLTVSGPLLLAWWLVTPVLVRARAVADRAILDATLVERLEERVETVTASRSATVDHSAAELRRIEQDLHDGAQARIAAVGMTVGLAERLMATDPDAALELLREARATSSAALDDLRSVVRGIHPPALADRGLAGAVEALVVAVPLPVTVAFTPAGARFPAPLESAAYFAVAEALANVVKHAGATRAWVVGHHSVAAGVLHLTVGDDGAGGADPDGHGLAGVRRRLAAFDGTLAVVSPRGGPTILTMEVPCPIEP